MNIYSKELEDAITAVEGLEAALAAESEFTMIQNDQELEATLERIERFQQQIEKIREVEANSRNYAAVVDSRYRLQFNVT